MNNKRFLKFVIIVLFSLIADVTSKQEESKPAKMFQQFVDLSSLDVVDYLRTIALLLAFVMVVFYDCGGIGYENGVNYMMLLFSCVAVFAPLSWPVISTAAVKLDVVHQFFAQAVGITILAIIGTKMRGYYSDQVHGSFILCSIISGLFSLAAQLSIHFGGVIKFNQQHITFAIPFTALIVVGHLVYIYRRGDFGRHSTQYSLNVGLNIHLMVDIVLLAIGACIDMSYTESFTDFIGLQGWKVDALHIHLVKLLGSMEVGMLIFSVLALGFSDDRDKRLIFRQRLVMIGSSVVVCALYQLKHGFFNRDGQVMMLSCFVVAGINSAWALCGNPVEVFNCVTSPQMVLRRKKTT